MPDDAPDHPADFADELLLAQCDVRRTRRSGPGGQHRNKVQSAVVLVHRPTGIAAEASERRSQPQNLAAALFRLRLKLALAVRRPADPDRPPSPLWRSRCRAGRLAVNPSHREFPALVAEALDILSACGLDPSRAAERSGCTPSQLVRLLRIEPAALALLNRLRGDLGLHPLR